jgi:hypothetical protein
MGGAEIREIHKLATIALTGLIGAGTFKLLDVGTKPLGQSTDFDPKEWKSWESESRVNFSSSVASKMVSPCYGLGHVHSLLL